MRSMHRADDTAQAIPRGGCVNKQAQALAIMGEAYWCWRQEATRGRPHAPGFTQADSDAFISPGRARPLHVEWTSTWC